MLEDIRRLLLRSDDERYINLAGRVHDPQEESVADLLFDINLADISRNVREVRDIEKALIRIRTGTYGICMDTGEPIGYDRLKAYSTAKRVRRAQEIHEKKSKRESHPTL